MHDCWSLVEFWIYLDSQIEVKLSLDAAITDIKKRQLREPEHAIVNFLGRM